MILFIFIVYFLLEEEWWSSLQLIENTVAVQKSIGDLCVSVIYLNIDREN